MNFCVNKSLFVGVRLKNVRKIRFFMNLSRSIHKNELALDHRLVKKYNPSQKRTVTVCRDRVP